MTTYHDEHIKALLEADKRRMDWLADLDNRFGRVQLPRVCVETHPDDMRAAIDAAMVLDQLARADEAAGKETK